MNKILGVLLAVAIVIGVVPYARSLGVPAPPKGVSASDWTALGDSAGFVVTHESVNWGIAGHRSDAIQGYFMVHRDGAWRRVEAGTEPEAHAASAR